MITRDDWQRILTLLGVRPTTAERWAEPFADEVQIERFSAGEADLVAWLPQILHECSLLERLEESLTYTPERIHAVWPTRFPTVAAAVPYAFAPQKLANLVYGGRMGNAAPDDGWKYRGRCPIMATGLEAYRMLSQLCGQDFDVMPELLLQPHFGLEAALLWWEEKIPDACLSDQVQLRRRVQGGVLGMEHVATLRMRLVEVLA